MNRGTALVMSDILFITIVHAHTMDITLRTINQWHLGSRTKLRTPRWIESLLWWIAVYILRRSLKKRNYMYISGHLKGTLGWLGKLTNCAYLKVVANNDYDMSFVATIISYQCAPIYMSGKFLTVPMHIGSRSLKKETTQKRAFYCCLVWASKVVFHRMKPRPFDLRQCKVYKSWFYNNCNDWLKYYPLEWDNT